MKHILQFFFVLISVVGLSQFNTVVPFNSIGQSCDGASTANDIFISEVYDSNGGTYGVIELHNPTNQTVNLANYRMRRRSTYGEDAWSTGAWNGDLGYQLSGNIPPNQTFLIIIPGNDNNCSQATSYPSNLKLTLSSMHGINERDQIQLLRNSNVVDDFRAPEIPGGTPTNDGGYTVRRKPDADVPREIHQWADWDIISLGSQNCSNLGNHTIDNPQPPIITNIMRQTTTLCFVPPQVTRIQLTFLVNDPPYTYSLNGGAFVNLPTTRIIQLSNTGNYTLIIKDDNDCTYTVTFTITGGTETSPIILLNP